MGVEVAGSELKPKLHDKESGIIKMSEPIMFGSHGVNEQEAQLPKNVVEEWPEPQVHSFWFIKYRMYEDPSLKAKIEQLDRDIQSITRRRSQIIDSLKPKQAERAEIAATLRSLGAESSKYWAVINEKRQEMKPLQDALGTLRGPGRGVGICSSEEELNELIRSLEYQIQHESLSLKEEKQILRQIKDLEATRPKVIANSAVRAKIEESLGQKEVIQDQVKLLGTNLDGVRKQKEDLKAKMDQLGEQLRALNNQINPLQQDLEALTKKRDDAFELLRDLRKKRDEGNSPAYENRAVINTARAMAAKKDVKALNDLVNTEVEKFMSNWNSSKAFRDDYKKRISTSLDIRQMSIDARMRNPDEKPIVKTEPPKHEPVVPKVAPKAEKKDPKVTTEPEKLPAQKPQKESKKKSVETKTASEKPIEEEDDDVFVVEKPRHDLSKENGIDEAKLKEMKKEEEKEKQRQALERKKKLQEKAAAKAALRAQREAEKKQKEREKKLKKKETTFEPLINEEEPTDKETEMTEPDKPGDTEEAVETSMPRKVKVQKEAVIRHRKTPKSRGTLPKSVMMMKKKSMDYWIWVAGAVAMVMVLVAVGYSYLL